MVQQAINSPPQCAPPHARGRRHVLHKGLALVLLAVAAGCSSPPPKVTSTVPPAAATAPLAEAPPKTPAPPLPQVEPPRHASGASNPRDYRRDAAAHLYSLHQGRIYRGKMPPLLYAVGVLQVDIDQRGMVTDVRWMRAPSHAPEVVAEIERSVRKAAPYPAPVKMGRVTYTDTWLWHKSGRFQLDTLTEGQI